MNTPSSSYVITDVTVLRDVRDRWETAIRRLRQPVPQHVSKFAHGNSNGNIGRN